MNSTEKRFHDSSIEPFPEVPGVCRHDSEQKPWSVVVEHLIKKEEDRCGVWKDEVENLTIYAGLFSAVVTAFIIESSKSLQDNPSDVLLSRIAVALERTTSGFNITNGYSSNGSVPDSLSTTSANKLVNALWFMSLVLSLSSALIGLVGLQWLREHLRPSTRNVPLKTLPAIIQMQADSLDAYYVPQMFTALSLFLIISIALFFVGLIQYLWNINQVVAYPSIITISLILGFILYTTIRPGLQGLPDFKNLHFDLKKEKTNPVPSVPCPYRSPQSWAFLQVVVLASSISSFIGRRLRLNLPVNVSERPSPTNTIRNWIDWAVSWPRIRDINLLRSSGDRHSLLQPFCDTELVFPPIYDTIRALTQTKRDFSLMRNDDFESSMGNAIHALGDFLDFDQGSQGFASELVGYVHSILDEPLLPLVLPREFVSKASSERQLAHAKLLFITEGINDLNDLAYSTSGETLVSIPDLLLLTVENLGTQIGCKTGSFGSPIALPRYLATRTFLGDGEDPEEVEKDDFDYVTRLAGIVIHIIEYASKEDMESLADNTLGTSPYLKTLLHSIANIIVDRSSITWSYSYPTETIQLNDGVLNDILCHLRNQASPPNPYLFLLASIYAHFLLVKVSPLFVNKPVYARTKAYDEVADILRQQYVGLWQWDGSQLRKYQEWVFPGSLEPGFIWAYLDPRYNQVQEDKNKEEIDEDSSLLSRSKSPNAEASTEKEDSGDTKREVSTVGDAVVEIGTDPDETSDFEKSSDLIEFSV